MISQLKMLWLLHFGLDDVLYFCHHMIAGQINILLNNIYYNHVMLVFVDELKRLELLCTNNYFINSLTKDTSVIFRYW